MTRPEALARDPLAIAGAVITTASAVVFIALVIAMLAGMLDNPYAGLVVFIAIPAVFVIGLLLMPLAAWRQRRALLRDPHAAAPAGWPVIDFRIASVRRTTLLIALLTAANVVIILLAGYGGLHAMESPGFCGQACHTPMHPQFSALQNGAHGHITCVSCHVGPGASGFVRAKMSGARQLLDVTTNSYPRPITQNARLPEGQQASLCVHCHQPWRPVGDRIRVIREYADDEKNTETLTVLQMHLGTSTASERAIHWHIDPAVKVEYVATDDEYQTIPYVKLTDRTGKVKEFRAADATDQVIGAGVRKTMDCIDCHNAVGHPFAKTPEQAVDRAIAVGMISRDLPFVRREAVRLMKASYPSHDAAAAAIDQGLRGFYETKSGADKPAVQRTVAALQDVYRQNVFPAMNVTWGTYLDNIGHVTSVGCFRCHDDSHEAKDGTKISGDCELCHKQIERP
jgi:hypothetical protein